MQVRLHETIARKGAVLSDALNFNEEGMHEMPERLHAAIPCKQIRGPSLSPVKPLEMKEDLMPFASDPSTPKRSVLEDAVEDTRFSHMGIPSDLPPLQKPLPVMVVTPASSQKRKQPALQRIEPKTNPNDLAPSLTFRESSQPCDINSTPSTTTHEAPNAPNGQPVSYGFFPIGRTRKEGARTELLLNGAPIKAGGGYIEHCDVEEECAQAKKKIGEIGSNERRNEEEFELLEIDEEMTGNEMHV